MVLTGKKRSMSDYEISVKDGHLNIRLAQLSDGWYARVESDIEGPIFEGRVTELSDLLAGQLPRELIAPPEDESA